MRLLHLADLHLGKYIGNYSLIEDQKYAIDQILNIIDEKKVDAVMIAGDIFDTSVASVDGLKLYSDFI
ncbi:MAG: metallophosphoesterase, partial [Anaerococcus sp.]|nr:metallophosphoesterase [Anaerococcus sp.]